MRKACLAVFGLVFLLLHQQLFAQRSCGAQALHAAIIARHPEVAQKLEEQKASFQGIIENYNLQQSQRSAGKTAAAAPIPVVFHIIVSAAQFSQLGGADGISRRCDSQIAVLNRDYNKQSLDAAAIPSGWLPLYGNANIQFGLAHIDPHGNSTPGYEINITSTKFSQGSSFYSDAKHTATGGLDAWDENKYLNIWCIDFSDVPGLLGITVPKSDYTMHVSPQNEVGICIEYSVLGKRSTKSDYYPATGVGSNYYDEGRTLTHEIGHFFEIWHTWGDDGGACPGSGGSDDGIADTPPEADAKYGMPAYTIPGGTFTDGCSDSNSVHKQPVGVGSLDFMNYTDDTAMHLFTPGQAAVMHSQIGVTGENYSLTQHPELLIWPANAGMAAALTGKSLNVFPNPSTGMVYITAGSAEDLEQVNIVNIIGQEVQKINTAGQHKDYYSIDLSGMIRGIYFVTCNFASGSITRKILLQ
jgi:hypothetical protein